MLIHCVSEVFQVEVLFTIIQTFDHKARTRTNSLHKISASGLGKRGHFLSDHKAEKTGGNDSIHNLPLYGNHWVIVAHRLLGTVSVHASRY